MKWLEYSIMWHPGVQAAATEAIKGEIAPFDSIEAIIGHGKYYSVALKAIYLYEKGRRERSIFRWYYRWRDRG